MSKGFWWTLIGLFGGITLLIVISSHFYSTKKEETQALAQARQDDVEVKNSYGYKLVVNESKNPNISVDNPRVAALNGKLDILSKQTGLSQQEIADKSYFITTKIKDSGEESNIDDVLEVIFVGVEKKAFVVHRENTAKSLSSWLAQYAIIRIKVQQSHATALESMRGILDILNDPEKMKKLEEIINKN